MENWYRVQFDVTRIYRDVAPPGGVPWSDEIEWAKVIRVCYQTGDFIDPDEVFVFTSDRPESYRIPLMAYGGSDLLSELMHRNLLPAELVISAASSSGSLACWPPE